MLALIKKDFVIQRSTLLIGLAYILLMMFAFAGKGTMAIVVSVVAVTYLLVQTPSAYDSRNNADMLLNSLPLKRSTIVAAKYLTVPIYFALALAEYSVVSLAAGLAGLPAALVPAPLSLGLIAMMALAVAFFSAIYFPITLRWGYLRTRYVNIILFVAVMALGSGASSLAGELELWVPPTALLSVASALILLVSFGLSVRLYARREF